jgi:hypothetical protein
MNNGSFMDTASVTEKVVFIDNGSAVDYGLVIVAW